MVIIPDFPIPQKSSKKSIDAWNYMNREKVNEIWKYLSSFGVADDGSRIMPIIFVEIYFCFKQDRLYDGEDGDAKFINTMDITKKTIDALCYATGIPDDAIFSLYSEKVETEKDECVVIKIESTELRDSEFLTQMIHPKGKESLQ